MKVLVTGASGLLGRAVAREIQANGHRVRTFQRRASGVRDAEDVLGSVTEPADVERAVSGVDAVVHLAAKVSLSGTLSEFESVNVTGTQNLLAAAADAGASRFVFVSSPSVAHSGSSIIGEGAGPADPGRAHGHYARTKARAELMALAADTEHLHVLAVRPHIVWGPGDTQLVERIVDRARKRRLPLIGHGAALIDTTYIDNAASAIAAALQRADSVHGQAYVISNGEPRPVAELLAGICAAAGVPAPSWRAPAAVARAAGALVEAVWRVKPAAGEPPMTRFLAEQLSTAHWFDQRKTRHDLQWEPSVTLEQGFAKLADWYRVD